MAIRPDEEELDPEILDAMNNHGQDDHYTVTFVKAKADAQIHSIFSINNKVQEDRVYRGGLESESSMGMDVTNWINNHF